MKLILTTTCAAALLAAPAFASTNQIGGNGFYSPSYGGTQYAQATGWVSLGDGRILVITKHGTGIIFGQPGMPVYTPANDNHQPGFTQGYNAIGNPTGGISAL